MDNREEEGSDNETRGRERFSKERTDSEGPEERRERAEEPDSAGAKSPPREDRREDKREDRRDDRRDDRRGDRGYHAGRDDRGFHGRDRFRRRDSFNERNRYNRGRGGGRHSWDSRDRDNRWRQDFHGGRDYPRGGRYDDRGRFDNRRNDRRDRLDHDRPEPASAVARMEPMETYKQFMMRQDDSNSPEVYQKRYEEYRKRYLQRLAEAFFEDHKDEEWLRQRYSPLIHREHELELTRKAALIAKEFREKAISGDLKPNLDELPPRKDKTEEGEKREEQQPAKDSGKGNFSLSDETTLLYIKRIPCSCPEGPLRAAIAEAGPYKDLYLSDPAKKAHHDFDRSGWIVYDTKAEADDALKTLNNHFMKDVPVPFRLQVYQHRPRAAILTPSFVSLPSRIKFDLDQAIEVADTLDVYRFTDKDLQVPDIEEDIYGTYGLKAILAAPEVEEKFPEDKEKLDLALTYLRLVHVFVYYQGVKCLDMGDLIHSHPALFRRRQCTARDREEDEARVKAIEEAESGASTSKVDRWPQWATTIDEKIKAILPQFTIERREKEAEKRAKVIVEIEERQREAEKRLYKLKVIPDEEAGPDDEKRRCGICQKLFKAANFVEKHIANKHADAITQEHAKAAEFYMRECYREDDSRPMPETQSATGAAVLGLPPPGMDIERHERGGGGGGVASPHLLAGALLPLPGPPMPMAMPPPMMGGPPPMMGGPFPHAGGPPGGFFGGRGGRGRGRGRGRGHFARPPTGENLPVDPRAGRLTSYADVDAMQDKKVELDFSSMSSLPPPKKKARISTEASEGAAATTPQEGSDAQSTAMEEAS